MAESENLEVTVKTLDSQTRSFTVDAEITVKDFKEHIAISVGIPSEKQRLIYQGRVLQDDKKLKDYNVDGKVIHLVERAPPQAQPAAGGSSGASTSTSSNGAGRGAGPTVHDRNANSYVMVGTFNLPVSITDTQQIQQSVQQVMSGLGEAGRNPRVTTGVSSSEPRLRLVMAQHMLRDVQRIVARLEGHSNGGQQEGTVQTSPEAPPDILETQGSNREEGMEAEAMDLAEAAAEAAAEVAAHEHRLETSFRVTVRMGETASTTTSAATTYAAAAAATPATAAAPAAAGASVGAPTPANDATANHPSPSDYVDVLQELRRLESRLGPFMQRYQDILGNATTADYNNNMEGREEDQRTINLVGECLRLLGNTFVALSDLRCNLSTNIPRHLHVVRPMSHYTAPMVLQQAAIPIQINTVTMTGNGSRASQPMPDGQESPASQVAPAQTAAPAAAGEETSGVGPESQGQTPPAGSAPTQTQASQTAHPRMIRITRQTVEPVVMMHMNMQDSGSPTGEAGNTPSATPGQGPGAAGATHMQMPTLPTEFIQAITNQITQQAMAMAAATGQPVSGVPGFPPAPTRVVFTRPTAPTVRNIHPGAPPPQGAAVPGNGGNAPLAQMISGLVGQLLMQPVLLGQGSPSDPASTRAPSSSSSSTLSSSSSISSSSSSNPSLLFSATSSMSSSVSGTSTTMDNSSTSASTTAPDPGAQLPAAAELQFSQLLGNLLGAAGSGVAGVPGLGTPTVTVAMPGMPSFLQGMTEFLQVTQTIPTTQPASAPQTQSAPPPQQPSPTPSHAPNSHASQPSSGPERAGRHTVDQDAFPPEFFTSVVQGVLSSMMGSLNAQHGSTESIADFIQRLSGSTNIFEPGADGALGFFGDLLSLICQNFSMVDIVMLLHGQFQPLQRIQPQLNRFFREEFLHNQEPTEQNTRMATDNLINGLEEYIRESFASVRVLEGVDITRTNLEFLQEQFNLIATHILHCTDHTFGNRLLELCNQGLFECLALNLYCLRGEQSALTAVINERIRLMSSDVNGSMVNWLTTMMGMRLQVILEQMPVTEEQILHYVRRIGDHRQQAPEEPMEEQLAEPASEMGQRETASPAAATTAEEIMSTQPTPVAMDAERPQREESESEPWAASVPPEWVPIIRQDIQTQRKMKQQPPLSDAYLHGMPAKRRKTMQCDGPQITLSEAVSKAAKATGTKPMTSSESLNQDLEEIQDSYREQLRTDVQKRITGDPNYSPQRFPNAHSVFEEDS
ncbi:large proline-rich protein BAG6 isoform X2 [Ambystoma mexicanum]|uniref:large proline-rich protein BAG6 isoform X2 n=1 Tax=Ambystoma mexicanum TaxID=8296 RepID=UPI0037E70922